MPNDNPRLQEDSRYQELVEWLKVQKYADSEIEKVLAKVAQYDSKTLHESIFDSIDGGQFSVADIIKEALDTDQPE